MSANEVILNEQALLAVAESISTYSSAHREAIETAVRGIKYSGCDWNDEDFNSLVLAISSFITDAESIDVATRQLVARINSKVEQIQVLHKLQI